MKPYIEVTGRKIIDAARKCGHDDELSYIYPENNYRVYVASFNYNGVMSHRVLGLNGRCYRWKFCISDEWYQKAREE
jgi:hypothetical protein